MTFCRIASRFVGDQTFGCAKFPGHLLLGIGKFAAHLETAPYADFGGNPLHGR